MISDLPPILLGCSPFIGAGQFGAKALQYYRRFYLRPDNMVRLFRKSFDLGVRAVQLLADKPVGALIEACHSTKVKPFIIYSTDLSGSRLRNMLDRLGRLEPEVVAVHAEISDILDVEKIMERLSIAREYGATAGLATHRPGVTIPWIEEAGIPVEVILSPLNRLGYAMEPDFERSLEGIKSCSRRVVAIKPLAAGRLSPTAGFEFVYRYVNSAAVGITSEIEMTETYRAAAKAHQERLDQSIDDSGKIERHPYDRSVGTSMRTEELARSAGLGNDKEENPTMTKQLIEEEEKERRPHCLYPGCARFVRVEYSPDSGVTYYVCKRHGRIPKKWTGLPR